jgi:hypothetical protein
LNRDYDKITSFLHAVRRLDWLARACGGILRLCVIAAVVLSVDILLVEGQLSHPWAGFALASTGTLCAWAAAVMTLRTLFGPLSLHRAGRRVETLREEFGSDIVSSLSLGSGRGTGRAGGISQSLLRGLVGCTAARLGGLRPKDFVSWSPLRDWALRFLVVAVPLLAILQLGYGLSPGAVRALVDPTVYWPLGKVAFEVSPGPARVVRGGDLAVLARVTGPQPGSVTLAFEEEGGMRLQYLMERQEERTYRHLLRDVDGDFRYRIETSIASSLWFPVETVEPPSPGSFEASYTYPAYTGIETRRLAVNGDLEALRGTSVELEFEASKELAEGRVFLGESAYEVVHTGGVRYRSSLYLNGEKSYRLELVDSEGFGNRTPLEYTIDYLPDRPPDVKIIEPLGETDLGSRGQISIFFQASDDYGLSRISLLYRNADGREVREKIFTGPPRKTVGEEYTWDVSSLDAVPGSLLPVFLEAVDNDTITGPKATLSNSFTLRVPDPDEEHRKTEQSLDEVIDDLIDLLADELELLGRYEEQTRSAEEEWEEFSWDRAAGNESLRESVQEAAAQAADSMEALAEQMSIDPLTRLEALYQFGLIRRQLGEMRQLTLAPMEELAGSLDSKESRRDEVTQKSDFLGRYAEDAVTATEQMILMAEEMQREQQMADVEEEALEMLSLQEQVLDALDQLSPEDRKGMEEVLGQLEEMERMLQELAEALEKENRILPEEFLNSDALQNLPLQDTLDAIERIRQMLRSGDIEGARAAAGELLKSLSDLMNRLQQASDDFEKRAEQAVSRLKNSTIPAIEKLIKEQEKILRQTEDLNRSAAERLQQALSGKGREEGRGEEEATGEDPGSALSEEERRQSGSLSETEERLQSSTLELAEEVGALKAALPYLNPEIEASLRGASREMKEAAGDLGAGSPGSAVAPERSALAELMNARDQARQSLQNMNQMQGYRMGKGGMPIMPGGMPGGSHGVGSSPSRGTRQGGRLGTNVRSFRIPGKEDYEVPPLFRGEILESLRDGYPEGYEERIKDYFHRITE